MSRPGRAPWSLQRRLIAGIVGLLAIVSVIVGAVTVAVQRQDLMSRLDDQVRVVSGFGDRGGFPGGGGFPGDGSGSSESGSSSSLSSGSGSTGSGGNGSGSNEADSTGFGSTGSGTDGPSGESGADGSSGGSGTGGSSGGSGADSSGSSGTGTSTGGDFPQFGPDDPGDGPRQRLGALTLTETTSGVTSAQYTADDGTVVSLTQGQIDALDAASLSSTPSTVELGDLGPFRVSEKDFGDGTRVISGLSLAELNTTVYNSVLIFGGVTLLALLVSGFGGALVVRVALRPLERIVSTARDVAGRPLGSGEVEIPERVPDRDSDPRTEVGQVGAALNHLLGNVEHALSDRQASEDRLRRFVGDASHELRTPLASIRGYAELSMRDETPMSETQTRAMERIDAESVRMSSLVEDLLLLARLDSGQPLRREPVDLTMLLADAISDAWAADQQHQWELDVDLEGDDGGVEVVGDPHRLHQVVANLLGNARTHTPEGTRVVASLASEDGWAVIRIADEGPGISPDLLPHIFERFARGDSSRARDTGSNGLGLSIVSAIVDAHGGTITATSTPAAGTTFTLRLPVSHPRDDVETRKALPG